MLSITTLKTKVTPKLHGASLAKVVGVYGKLHEASGNVFSRVKPYTVIRKARIDNAIYDHVFNYSCQDDLEVDSVIDIRPVAPRNSRDSLKGTYSKEFDIKKASNSFTVEYINGIKTLRLSKCLTPRIVLFEADALDGNVTLSGSGDVDATSIQLDYLDFVSGQASVSFDLTGATGQGIITLTMATPITLAALYGQGSILPWFKFPDVSKLINVKIRAGSSSSDYYETTCVAALNQGFTSDFWMLLLQKLETATAHGTPNLTTGIAWMQIEINYTSGTAQPNVKIDNITAALGQAWEVVYYSNRMFTDSTGLTWKEIPTADTDLIRLEGAMDNNAFMYEFMLTLQQELKGKSMAADYAFFQTSLFGRFGARGAMLTPGIYDALERKYPNQAIMRQVEYYNFDDDEEMDEGFDDVYEAPPYLTFSSGNTYTNDTLTPTAVGTNIQIDLTQLTHPYRFLQFISLNGLILDMGPDAGDGTTSWSRSGDIVTIYNAAITDSVFVFYTY